MRPLLSDTTSAKVLILVPLLLLPLFAFVSTVHADEPGPSSPENVSSDVAVVEKTEKIVSAPVAAKSHMQKTVTKTKSVETEKYSKSSMPSSPGGTSFAGGGSGSAAAVSNVGSFSSERLASAIGHYARARALIISAVNEFDQGRKLSDPNPLLDGETWRNAVIDRAEDLERVLDPQPRTTRTGVKFDADPRLLGQGK